MERRSKLRLCFGLRGVLPFFIRASRGRGPSSTARAVHDQLYTPGWALATLPPSLALGWLRERRDSSWAPIGVHAAFNLEFFAIAALK